jgi:hypothetical protein
MALAEKPDLQGDDNRIVGSPFRQVEEGEPAPTGFIHLVTTQPEHQLMKKKK